MMFEEIKRGINRITGAEMIFAYSEGYDRYALLINGRNQKCSDRREEVESLFDHLCQK